MHLNRPLMADDSSETVNSAMFERGAACIVANMDSSCARVYSRQPWHNSEALQSEWRPPKLLIYGMK